MQPTNRQSQLITHAYAFTGFRAYFLCLLLVFFTNVGYAKTVSHTKAKKAVSGWLKKHPRPFGIRPGQSADRIQTFSDANGLPIYHVVDLQPAGFIIVSADDNIEPIIAFSENGAFDSSPDNPLTALVTRDLNDRLSTARTWSESETKKHRIKNAARRAKIERLKKRASVSKARWNKLTAFDDEPESTSQLSITDVRVEPLILSQWSQSTTCGYACYNFYTPPYSEGNANNYVCGCVATAMAQLMRFHQYPVAGVDSNTVFIIKVDDVNEPATLIGSDGNGAPYDWQQMPLVPDCSTTLEQRQAIGSICYDAGVSVEMEYSSDASGAYTSDVDDALEDIFGYNNAIQGNQPNWTEIGAPLAEMINPNLDAGFPTLLSIKRIIPPGGHAILCDGYGYDEPSIIYHHLNMGWAGSSDAWYNLPDILDYDVISACVYNVFPYNTGEIISGRVTDSAGNPIEDANVTATGDGNPDTVKTNEKGIYAITNLTSSEPYQINVTKTGHYFQAQNISTGLSLDEQNTSGNKWQIDFTSFLPPCAYDVNSVVRMNTSVSIPLSATDDGLPQQLSYIITSLPPNGILTDPATGLIESIAHILDNNSCFVIYTPDQGYSGSDTFSFKADDGGTPPGGGPSNDANVSISIIEYFTELFDYNNNDLAYQSFTFTPDDSPAGYRLCRDIITGFPTDPNGASTITILDDDSVQVHLADGKEVRIYGDYYSSFHLNSNGCITFDSNDSAGTGTLADHFAQKRISALFKNLNPSTDGDVSVKQLEDRAVVTFEDVPDYNTANANSFQFELFFNGTIRLAYLNIDAADGLAGLSDGNGIGDDFIQSDLSAARICADFDFDNLINIYDISYLVESWLMENCPNSLWCDGADFNRDGSVNFHDISYSSEYYRDNSIIKQPVNAQYTLYSISDHDGRVWAEPNDANQWEGINSNSDDSSEYALRLGDWGTSSYRSIVSFDTSLLPQDAQVTSARLTLIKAAESGDDPFDWGGPCLIDVAIPYFGDTNNLVPSDWQVAPDAVAVTYIPNPYQSNVLLSSEFDSNGLTTISSAAANSVTTQLRVYFSNPKSGTDSDHDLIGCYSGEQELKTNRPMLKIHCKTKTPIVEFASIPAEDGRVWAEPNAVTGRWEGVNSNSTDDDKFALRLGCINSVAYKSILSFDTSPLPDDSTILLAYLEMTRTFDTGSNPFDGWGGSCNIDIANPYFGTGPELENCDWQANATVAAIAEFGEDPGDDMPMTSTDFAINSLSSINKTGKTQLRVYFTVPVTGGDGYICAWPGEADAAQLIQPKLIIKYSVD